MGSLEERRQIFIGDIHGELDGFREILEHARFVDVKGNWAGGDSVLVQTGDVIDRGPCSVQSVALLRKLQDQAPRSGGQVVRLCGNHELMLLQGDYTYVNFENPDGLRAEVKQEIAEGTLKAAYTDGQWLCTHAGMRSIVRQRLYDEIRSERRDLEEGTIDLRTLAEHINTVFRSGVKQNFRDHHAIFWVGSDAGGSDPVGGIFWCRYDPLSTSDEAWTVPQIFGHTPTREDGVKHAWDLHLIDIDAGLCKIYGGNRVYLEIDAQGRIIQHSRKGGKWLAATLRGAGGTDKQPGAGEHEKRRTRRTVTQKNRPWTTVWDRQNRRVLLLAGRKSGDPRWWEFVKHDPRVSVPGAYDIWRARKDIVFVEIRLDEGCNPIGFPHDLLSDDLLGSMTLWPGPKMNSFIWWHEPA